MNYPANCLGAQATVAQYAQNDFAKTLVNLISRPFGLKRKLEQDGKKYFLQTIEKIELEFLLFVTHGNCKSIVTYRLS